MAYLQIQDILDNACNLRRFMKGYAQRRARSTPDDHAEGLYEIVNNQEQRLLECLTGFLQEAPRGLTETWIQYPGVESVLQAMDQLSAASDEDDEAVLRLVLDAENALLDVYKQAASQTQAAGVREFFEHLRILEDHYLRTLASCFAEFDQMKRPPASYDS